MTAQLGLVGPDLPPVRDHLSRRYTPDGLAVVIVDTLAPLLDAGCEPLVVEPSVGGGAFARAIRASLGTRWGTVVGVDLDPGARGLGEVDHGIIGSWPEIAAEWRQVLDLGIGHALLSQPPDIIIGNPPFTGDEGLAHVDACLLLRPRIVSLVLPWAYWGVQRWSRLLRGEHRPAIVRPIVGRPWSSHVREAAVYEWHPGARPSRTMIVDLPGVWT